MIAITLRPNTKRLCIISMNFTERWTLFTVRRFFPKHIHTRNPLTGLLYSFLSGIFCGNHLFLLLGWPNSKLIGNPDEVLVPRCTPFENDNPPYRIYKKKPYCSSLESQNSNCRMAIIHYYQLNLVDENEAKWYTCIVYIC